MHLDLRLLLGQKSEFDLWRQRPGRSGIQVQVVSRHAQQYVLLCLQTLWLEKKLKISHRVWKRSEKNQFSNWKTGWFAINCKSSGFFCVCRTIAFHDGNNPKKFGGKFDWELGVPIEQALHLSKSLPVTDTSMKMGFLSVNGLLKKWQLRTEWAKMAVCP